MEQLIAVIAVAVQCAFGFIQFCLPKRKRRNGPRSHYHHRHGQDWDRPPKQPTPKKSEIHPKKYKRK